MRTRRNQLIPKDYWEYKYGIDPEVLVSLYREQGGRCKICKTLPKPDRELAIDHDHETGVIRGFLCTRCNMGLGYFKTTELLMEAIVYLSDVQNNPNHIITSTEEFKKKAKHERDEKEHNILVATKKVVDDVSLPSLRAKARMLSTFSGLSEEAAMSRIRRYPDVIAKNPQYIVST